MNLTNQIEVVKLKKVCLYEIKILVGSQKDIDVFVNTLTGKESRRLYLNHDKETFEYSYKDSDDNTINVVNGICDESILNIIVGTYGKEYTNLKKLTKDLRIAIVVDSHQINHDMENSYYIVNGKIFKNYWKKSGLPGRQSRQIML